MKRGLAWSLVLALSLCLLSGFAAAQSTGGQFLDWGSVREKAAVALLEDLGLVSGYSDGTFRPDRLVTRAEAAKMIAGLLPAEETVQELPAADPVWEIELGAQLVEPPLCRYPDAAGSWAAPYIERCAEAGAISGPAGADFCPGRVVTVRELAKMLLAVLGYDPAAFTGARWAEAVDVQAEQAGLYRGVESGGAAGGATREMTCLLLRNALQGSVVRGYSAMGEPVFVLDEMLQPRSLLELRFEAIPVTGIVQANAAGDLREAGEPVAQDCIHLSGYVKDFEVAPEVALDRDLLGHRVTLYARFGEERNQLLGLPAPVPEEIAYTLTGRMLYESVLDAARLTMDEATQFYLNGKPAEASCVGELGEDGRVTILDYDGDHLLDMILVWCGGEPAEGTPG